MDRNIKTIEKWLRRKKLKELPLPTVLIWCHIGFVSLLIPVAHDQRNLNVITVAIITV